MQPGVDEVTCLEYGQLKVHYEILNKKFRAAQKIIDQHNFYFKRNFDAIDDVLSKIRKNDEPLPISSISKEFRELTSRLTACLPEIDSATSSETSAAETMHSAADYLKEGMSRDPKVREIFAKQRANRFIIEHLLRNGYFETAQKLAEYVDAKNTNKNVFHVAKQVEEALQRKDLSICLHWVVDNRSKLHRLNSQFETEVRIQQLIELIKQGKRLESVSFLKNYFGNTASNKWKSETLLKVMGLLAFGPETNISDYQKLIGDERWERMVELFREENAKIFRLSGHSAFSACLQVGIAVHKTPFCKRDPDSRCLVCRDLYDIAEGLPYAHVENSRLICAYTGEPLGDDNRPMALSNGRVYGERAIAQLTKDNMIVCPRTNEVVAASDVERVYVL